jgi:hypothetical protein
VSVKLMGLAWETSLPQAEKFVLLALCDHAHDDGSHVYPSISYLAWKVGASVRTIQRTMRALEERGVILPVRHRQGGRGFATEYRIVIEAAPRSEPYQKGAKLPPIEGAGKDANVTPIPVKGANVDSKRVPNRRLKGDTAMAPQPSGTIIEEPSDIPASSADGPSHQVYFDALIEATGLTPGTVSERKMYGDWAKRYRAEGKAPGDIVRLGQTMRRVWPKTKCSPGAISKHWSWLDEQSQKSDPASRRAGQAGPVDYATNKWGINVTILGGAAPSPARPDSPSLSRPGGRSAGQLLG